MKKILFTMMLIPIVFYSCSKKEINEEKPVIPIPIATTVASYAPSSAKAGEEVTVTGTGFGSDKSKITISFSDGTTATIKSVTDTQITFVVPIVASSGQLSIVIKGITFKPSQAFTFMASGSGNNTAVITSYAPISGKSGDDITISGTGFGTDKAKVTVSFTDGTLAVIKSVSDIQIVFTVPTATISGQLTVVINGTIIKPTQAFSFLSANGNTQPIIQNIASGGMTIGINDAHTEVEVGIAMYEVDYLPYHAVRKYSLGGDIKARLVNVTKANTTTGLTSANYSVLTTVKNLRKVSFSENPVVNHADSATYSYLELSGNSLKDATTNRPLKIRYFFTDDGLIGAGTISLRSLIRFTDSEANFEFFKKMVEQNNLKKDN